jgi:hypothetical protein
VHGILEHLLIGDATGAWSLYQCIDVPSAQEDRWAGWALINLERHFEANDLLIRSVQRGCLEARIELATVQRLQGSFQTALLTLNALEYLSFQEPFDEALYWREIGMVSQNLHLRRCTLHGTSFSVNLICNTFVRQRDKVLVFTSCSNVNIAERYIIFPQHSRVLLY